MNSPVIDLLLARRSAPIHELTGPEPTQSELKTMFRAATRVPDHAMLTPWRFILYRGETRESAGQLLADLLEQREGPLNDAQRKKELTRFSRAPLVVGVVSSPKENATIPQWEMFLSGGMAAMNFMIAANALGYQTNIITNWYSDTEEGRRILGIAPHERVIGFIHIGRHPGGTPDRPRPDVEPLVSDYSGPWED